MKPNRFRAKAYGKTLGIRDTQAEAGNLILETPNGSGIVQELKGRVVVRVWHYDGFPEGRELKLGQDEVNR